MSNNNNINEFLFFKTPVGGVLAISKGLSPSDFVYINKSSYQSKSADYVLNVWGSGGSDTSPYNICKTLHKDEDINLCIANSWDLWVSTLHNGGVRGFEADDNDGNRQVYRACWMSKDNNKILDFKDKYFAGYYPQVDNKNYCFGTPYQVNLPKEKDDKSGEFESSIQFQISLPLDK
jgi:hypothetical protein